MDSQSTQRLAGREHSSNSHWILIMFGLAKETKLDFLLGCELEQIAFSPFQLILRFSHSVELSVESRLELKAAGNPTTLAWESNHYSELPRLAALFGLSVTDYETPGDGRLILHFGDENALTAFDSNQDHESYQISGGGTQLIV
ncbi:MAG TPA: DUF6188 family protein [Clostridia bacterium]|nr:DUF6188 family protein [Clostridia bacterium]